MGAAPVIKMGAETGAAAGALADPRFVVGVATTGVGRAEDGAAEPESVLAMLVGPEHRREQG